MEVASFAPSNTFSANISENYGTLKYLTVATCFWRRELREWSVLPLEIIGVAFIGESFYAILYCNLFMQFASGSLD